MVKTLITGSAGFVGRHFDERLTKDGHDIRRVDIFDPDVPTDCRDFFRYNHEHYDLVIHLAAIVGGRATIESDPLAIAQNLAIDSDMFRWATRTKPGRVIYFSSSAAYPIYLQDVHHQVKLSEEDIPTDTVGFGFPDQTYGWAKLTGELLARYAQDEGLRVQVFRPFSGYGTDQHTSYPFPAFIDRALRRSDPFDIWGDGEQARDWIHIDDIVGAVMAAIKQDVDGPINLCTGTPTRFDVLAATVTNIAGYHPEFRHLTAKPTGVVNRVGDPTKLNTFYMPKVSLSEGISRALAGE